MSELQLGQTKIKCVWVLRGDLDSQLSSLESKILTTPETLSSTLTLRSKNQGLNFEKENLIKKSKEEVNGVEREASNRNSIEIQKHLFSLILNFKVCNILERRKRKLPSTRKPRKRIPPKKLHKILFSNPPRARSDTGLVRACWMARLTRASFFSLARGTRAKSLFGLRFVFTWHGCALAAWHHLSGVARLSGWVCFKDEL